VVISEYQEEVADVFRKKAAETGSELIFASSCLHVNAVERDMAQQTIEVGAKDIRDTITYELDLLGTYQSKNLLGVLAAVDQLRSLGWSLPQDSVQAALSKVRKLTGLRGRWEVLGHSPLLVCDTGHNADGWKEVMQNINRTPHHNLHLVLGVMADKDLDEMLPVLPLEAKYYFCQVDLPRAMPARELAQKAEAYGLLGQYYDNVLAATAEALKMADSQDLIFVGGSTFIVGDLLANRI